MFFTRDLNIKCSDKQTERFNSHFRSGRCMSERVRDKTLKVALLMGGNG
jgi:hypothetical protein